jgi:transposase InsO family protein
LQLTIELLLSRIAYLESGRRVDIALASLHASAHSIACRCPYTLARVCRAWSLSRSTVYRRRKAPQAGATAPRHITLISDQEIAARLREIIHRSPFPAERHRKLWARLRREGILVSRERVRRILSEFQILPPRGNGILTDHPDVMWGIDSTTVGTAFEGGASVLFAIDHCTAECLAIDVIQEETAAAWVDLIRRGIHYAFGRLSPGCAAGLTLRHDNLPLFREESFRSPLRVFGVAFSRSPILSPQMNGCAERFVRTIRDNLLSIQFFERLADLSASTAHFRTQYNEQWLLARAGYRTPIQLRENTGKTGRDGTT